MPIVTDFNYTIAKKPGATNGRAAWSTNYDDDRKNVLSFDGDGDSVLIDDDTVYDFTTALTLSTWIKTTDTGYNYILTKWESASGTDSYHLALTSSGTIIFTTSLTGSYTSSRDLSVSSSINDGNWHYLVATYDNTNAKIYLDGVEIATKALTGSLYNSSTKLAIGALGGGSLPTNNMNGDIAEVSVWDKAFTAEEVLTAYNTRVYPDTTNQKGYWKLDEGTGSTAADSSTNDNNGTITGATW